MTTETQNIVLEPVASTVTLSNLYDPTLRYVSDAADGRDKRGRPKEPLLNTKVLCDDFATDPTSVAKITMPVQFQQVSRGRDAVILNEIRGLTRGGRSTPRLRIVSTDDGLPLGSNRVRYQRAMRATDTAGLIILSTMSVSPGMLYTISVIDTMSGQRTTLIYRLDEFLTWPSDAPYVPASNQHGRATGVANMSLIAAITVSSFGEVRRWVGNTSRGVTTAVSRLDAAVASIHRNRDAPAYRQFFRAVENVPEGVIAFDTDDGAPSMVSTDVDPVVLARMVVAATVEARVDRAGQTVSDKDSPLGKLLRSQVPVGVRMSTADGGISMSAFVNFGTHMQGYHTFFTEFSPDMQVFLNRQLYGINHADYQKLYDVIEANGGERNFICAVSF